MKLYTEEQLRAAYNDGVENGHCGYGREYEEQFINSLTPISLPSDEEINAEAISQTDKFNPIWSAKGCFSKGYIEGAKWVLNKLKNKQ